MSFDIEVDRGPLSEQPLSVEEKRVLSDYFQLEGQRQFGNYSSLQLMSAGKMPLLFDFIGLEIDLLNDLSEKKLTLELSQRDHWIDLIKSIHRRFYKFSPLAPEIMLWALISLEKHAIVEIETGREEYKQLLREAQRRQLPLISRLGEQTSSSYAQNISLFYQLLNIDGLSKNLIIL